MKRTHSVMVVLIMIAALFAATINTGCGVYSFADVSVPDSVKVVRVNFLDNKARYVNPQLSPQLTERLRLKITNQTRLTQTTGENAQWDISGFVSDYSVSTSAISSSNQNASGQAAVTNRLTVSVRISVANRLNNTTQEYDVTRSFEFDASQSLQAAEGRLIDEIVRNLADDLFNRLFSNW